MSSLVVAVDLGTSRSAWAYSLPSKAEEDIVVRVPRGSESCSVISMKTETAVLLTSDGGRVVAFGRNAQRRFIQQIEAIEGEGGAPDGAPPAAKKMLFRWFKVHLCHKRGYQSVNDPVAVADGGEEMPLLKLVTAALRHFKEDVLQHLSELLEARLGMDRVKWVLTIPAIFDDFAKRFMRHAAFRAGMINTIDSSSLILCLEPEAACLSVNMVESPNIIEGGSKVMILDCGGGTVDITTHEVVSTSPLCLKEILAPTGGPWGSAGVDDAFREWLRVFLGNENYKRIQHTSAFLSLLEQWEDGKTQFRGEESDSVRLNFVEIAKVLDDMSSEKLQVRT